MGYNQIKVELQEFMGSDRSIAEAAWTSSLDFQKKQTKADEDVVRIVNMLADCAHSTPFESVVFRFWIQLPIQTDRQHMTHRIASHNGLSGRYRTMPNDWCHMPKDVVGITKKIDSYLAEQYENLCKDVNKWYNDALRKAKDYEKGGQISNVEYKRFREFIRGVLPLNNMTERVSVFNLRSFANYYRLRSALDAQPEIQYIAKQMLEKIKEKNVCPIAIEALSRNGWRI